MHELALFAGAGGGILAGRLLGWDTRCAVEIDPYARDVLLARQRDGMLGRFPIWDDVRTFDGRPWRNHIDIITGGFPCQDISSAGTAAGIHGAKSGLWREMARITDEVRPTFVFVENSPMLRYRGLETIIGDFASMGYDARWCVLGACHVAAPHQRERTWILARDTNGNRQPIGAIDAKMGRMPALAEIRPRWWQDRPPSLRVVDGLANRVERYRTVGNGQVPAVAAFAFVTLFRDMIK